jgi:hypothetical protein
VWRAAPVADAFRQREPGEDKAPTFRTTVQVAADARALYVRVRAEDPHPDSLIALLSRRDADTPSDIVRVFVDSYHDRRTAYSFGLTPRGVQSDSYLSADGDSEDGAWDAVWQGQARVDATGWTATFRIPLSQLRFPPPAPGRPPVFGIAVARRIARLNETDTWPLVRRSATGLVSQFGTLEGLDAVRTPRRLEVLPYFVERSVTRPAAAGPTGAPLGQVHPQQRSAGLDLKYGLSSNLTLDATVNPDFGQVEADPAVLNLTAFEQFFPERRPFFVEGTNIFKFEIDCSDGGCSGLFYPRRIGRSPQLAGRYGNAATPQFTGVLGAAKLTGRLARGLSVGLLTAATERVRGAGGETAEPGAGYAVARLQQDLRNGNSGLGLMLTGMDRRVDRWSAPYLRSRAYATGMDGRHRFGPANHFEVQGYVAASRVEGTAAAMAITQRSGVHNFQRPGSGMAFDSTRTRLEGTAAAVSVGKVGGGITRFNVSAYTRSPGFDVNDVGYLDRADSRGGSVWGGLQMLQPRGFYRRLFLNTSGWAIGNTSGDLTGLGWNVNVNSELKNYWFVYAGGGPRNFAGVVVDDRAARGGPAVRRTPGFNAWGGVNGDSRRPVAPTLGVYGGRRDGGRSSYWGVDPGVEFRVASRLQGNLGVSFGGNTDDWQWAGNMAEGTDSAAHTFARLTQHTASVTARVNVTATPWLSFQVYAQPFLTGGAYDDWRALADGGSPEYAGRWRPYADPSGAGPGGFNYKQYRSNVVMRWEWRPGSTLFAVWQQGRTQGDRDPGSFDARRDARNLFRTWPDNTLLLKVAYWFNP